MKGEATEQKASVSGSYRAGRWFVVAAVWAMTLAVGMGEGGRELRKVTFLPHWIPQAQFAGYYMAEAKGLYTKRGLDVSILRGRADVPPDRALATGGVDFATMFLAVALEKREKDRIPLVNIAQVVQRSSVVLIAHRSAGIKRIQNLDGKRLYAWPDTQVSALIRNYNLNVKMIVKTSSDSLFLRRGADAMSAMWYNEYHNLLNAGLDAEDMDVFFLRDHGLGFPEDGIYCLKATLDAKPDVCRDFVAASMEGWQYAFSHTNETIQVVMAAADKAKTGTNVAHQRWMFSQMRGVIVSGDRITGALSPEAYAAVTRELKAAAVVTNALPLSDFHVQVSDNN